MALNSETVEDRLNAGSFRIVVVTLDIQSFTSPETYDPTVEAGTTAGQKVLDNLLGAAVLGVENDVDVSFDHLSNEIRATSQDGTAAPSDLGEVRLALFGEAAP